MEQQEKLPIDDMYDKTAVDDETALVPEVAQAMAQRLLEFITQNNLRQNIAHASMGHLMVLCLYLAHIESRPLPPIELTGRERFWLPKDHYVPANLVKSPPSYTFHHGSAAVGGDDAATERGRHCSSSVCLENSAGVTSKDAGRHCYRACFHLGAGNAPASLQISIVRCWFCASPSIRTALPNRAPQ